MESTPSCDISLIYCLRNIRIRSGRENERPINIKYLPKVVSHFSIIMSIFYEFCCKIKQNPLKNCNIMKSFSFLR